MRNYYYKMNEFRKELRKFYRLVVPYQSGALKCTIIKDKDKNDIGAVSEIITTSQRGYKEMIDTQKLFIKTWDKSFSKVNAKIIRQIENPYNDGVNSIDFILEVGND